MSASVNSSQAFCIGVSPSRPRGLNEFIVEFCITIAESPAIPRLGSKKPREFAIGTISPTEWIDRHFLKVLRVRGEGALVRASMHRSADLT
jgi:hypothetical protein